MPRKENATVFPIHRWFTSHQMSDNKGIQIMYEVLSIKQKQPIEY